MFGKVMFQVLHFKEVVIIIDTMLSFERNKIFSFMEDIFMIITDSEFSVSFSDTKIKMYSSANRKGKMEKIL